MRVAHVQGMSPVPASFSPVETMICFDARSIMRRASTRALLTAAMLLGASWGASPLRAQTMPLPALQLPEVSARDYTAALVGGGGTAALVQWREAVNGRTHWQLEGGLADVTGRSSPMVLLGIGAARSLQGTVPASPFQMLLTGGATLSVGGSASVVRVPVGVSVGRGIELEGGTRLTPFVHPRVSLDYCARCGVGEGSRSTVSINADIGAAWRFDPKWELLAAFSYTGSELVTRDETVTIGLRLVPEALKRR
jgi:hypothetical protein